VRKWSGLVGQKAAAVKGQRPESRPCDPKHPPGSRAHSSFFLRFDMIG